MRPLQNYRIFGCTGTKRSYQSFYDTKPPFLPLIYTITISWFIICSRTGIKVSFKQMNLSTLKFLHTHARGKLDWNQNGRLLFSLLSCWPFVEAGPGSETGIYVPSFNWSLSFSLLDFSLTSPAVVSKICVQFYGWQWNVLTLLC